MSYQLNRFDGSPFINVQDGTVDSTTNLKLVGKNWPGYGEIQNENFVFLLENFSSGTPPAKAISGQVWYDSGTKKLKFYDGSKFRTTGGAEVSSIPPTGLTVGDFWFDTNTAQLKAWNGTDFSLIGPQGVQSGGKTQMSSENVRQLGTTNTYPVIKAFVGDTVMAVFSETAFTPDTGALTGFAEVKQGITLRGATVTTGVSSGNSNYLWGTAADSLRLGGLPASSYITSIGSTFGSLVTFSDAGLQIGGDTPVLKIYKDGPGGPVIENLVGSTITLRIVSNGVAFNIARLDDDAMYPGTNGQFNLGKSTLKWDNVFANTFNGAVTGNVIGNTTGNHKGGITAADDSIAYNAATKTFFGTFNGVFNATNASIIGVLDGTVNNALTLTGKSPASAATNDTIVLRTVTGSINATAFNGPATQADSLKVGSAYRVAATTTTGDTIAARDAAGDIYARFFQGTATSANYADLAEKYLADADYAPGTVVSIGGEKEVTASRSGDIVLGVVSTNPAYMMNSELEGGTYIALKGRVPVKVSGPVNKGNALIAGADGCGVQSMDPSCRAFAVALETNLDPGVKIIEAAVL
jgi:hypothetical protein